jgi:regulatory protein
MSKSEIGNRKSQIQQYLIKAANYCAYQERTHAEVRERLAEWGIYGNDAEQIIAGLIEENFLSEERFAKAFAGGKFRVKNWGRLKIKYELKARGLSDYCIRVGMAEIEDDEYLNTLNEILEKKTKELKFEKDKQILKQKLARYAIGKGYESDLVWEVIGRIIKSIK